MVTHGMTNTRLYRIYHGITQRCTNPKCKERPFYGGKGVKNQWNNFDEFYRDMGKSYENHIRDYGEKDTTIDRIDVDGDYCKENCRWTTRLEQCNNRTSNSKIMCYGKEYPSFASLCREYNISKSVVKGRLKTGWTIEKAVETPTHSYHKKERYALI